MTIEIADRLVKLRKKYGYSQEELADKLGLSRQAVSKWERAEASPDTDNLICLAKLYGVSLDELLATDEDIDTIVEEQVKNDDKKEEAPKEDNTSAENNTSDGKKHDKIIIDDHGIFLQDEDGSSISIGKGGVKCCDKDKEWEKKWERDRGMAIIGCIEGVLFLLAVVAYVLLGSLAGLWGCAWIVVFIPEIICSIARAIRKKNAQNFNISFTACFAFFLVCMFLPRVIEGFPEPLWHPMWVVFLAIPVYHTTVSAINKIIGKEVLIHIEKGDDDEEDKVVANQKVED